MKRKRFTVEQIIRNAREAEVHLSQGKSVKLMRRRVWFIGLLMTLLVAMSFYIDVHRRFSKRDFIQQYAMSGWKWP